MIHTARQSGKFVKLVRRLRAVVPPDSFAPVESVAVAILERLWHATASGAPRGDIGRFDDEIIAELVGWPRDAAELIDLLCECGWLDRSPDHRLIVHDWPQLRKDYLPPIGRRLDLGRPEWRRIRAIVIREFGAICHYCGRDCRGDPTVDHVVPFVLGGTIDRENLVVACRQCNGRKGDR